MVETNYIVMEFVKSNGEKHSLKVAYPKVPAVAADVKSLADFIVTNKVFSFEDASTITSFTGAAVQTITEADINFAI